MKVIKSPIADSSVPVLPAPRSSLLKTIRAWSRHAAAAALVLGALSAPAVHAACRMVRLAELPTAGDRPLIPVSLDGQPAQMLVDTGSFESFLWRSAAAQLHLDQTSSDVGAGYGVGGRAASGLVTIRQFALGEYLAHNLTIATLGRRESAPAANPWSPAVGILGEDFLSRMDVELDLASGKIRLFDPKGCNGDQVVYWASAYNMLTMRTVTAYRAPVATVLLDGHEVVALFDTGASRSVVQTDVVTRPGMSPESQSGSDGALRGAGPAAVAASTARFTSLTIGQESIRNPTLKVADMSVANREEDLGSHVSHSRIPFDLVLGVDFLRAHRMYIAQSQGKIYFTYSGGAIFEPPQPATPPTATSPAPAAAAAAAPPAAPPSAPQQN